MLLGLTHLLDLQFLSEYPYQGLDKRKEGMLTRKLKLEIDDKNKEISKIESILDEINHELLKIKNNILANKNE